MTRLLESGVDPNAPNRDGRTAPYVAAVQRSAAIVEQLLEAGADPNL